MYRMLKLYIILFFSNCLFAQTQWVIIDSVIIDREISIRPYPYQAKYDSLLADQNKWTDQLRAEHPDAFICPTFPRGEFYAVTDNNNELHIREYLAHLREENPGPINSIVILTVAWDGTISEVSVSRYQNQVPDFDMLKRVTEKIRAKPAFNEAGFPNPRSIKYSFPFPYIRKFDYTRRKVVCK